MDWFGVLIFLLIALEKPGFATQEPGNHLERFNFQTTLNQIKKKGKRPPGKNRDQTSKEMVMYAYRHF